MLPLLWSIQLVKSWCQAITYTPTNFELAESDNCETILQPYKFDVIAKMESEPVREKMVNSKARLTSLLGNLLSESMTYNSESCTEKYTHVDNLFRRHYPNAKSCPHPRYSGS